MAAGGDVDVGDVAADVRDALVVDLAGEVAGRVVFALVGAARPGTTTNRELELVVGLDVVTGRAASDGRLWSVEPVDTVDGST